MKSLNPFHHAIAQPYGCLRLVMVFAFLVILPALSFIGCNSKTTNSDDENLRYRPATTTQVEVQRADGKIDAFGFEEPVEFKLGRSPLSFVVADLNSDKLSDVAVLDSIDANVHILIQNQSNNYATRFSLATTVMPTSTLPQYIVAEDVNRDGFNDLVVVNSEKNFLGFYIGTSNNTLLTSAENLPIVDFTIASTPIYTGLFPIHLVSADLEPKRLLAGPNRKAWITANLQDNDLSIIFPEDGFGKYPLDTPLKDDGLSLDQRNHILIGEAEGLNRSPSQVAVGDFNEDGFIDIAALSLEKHRVNILLNIPRPLSDEDPTPSATRRTFGFTYDSAGVAINYSVNVGESPKALIVGDWDGDGHLDIAVTQAADDEIALLYGSGKGSFERFDMRVGHGPGQFTSYDFNQDGVKDFLISNTVDKDLGFLISNGDGKRPKDQDEGAYVLVKIKSGILLAGSRPSYIAAEDVNKDGKVDILVTLPFEEKISILFGK